MSEGRDAGDDTECGDSGIGIEGRKRLKEIAKDNENMQSHDRVAI